MTEAQIRAERILDGMQFGRDAQELRVMNGDRCGNKQTRMLSRYKIGTFMREGYYKKQQKKKGKKQPVLYVDRECVQIVSWNGKDLVVKRG
jgi:hypothetical protein